MYPDTSCPFWLTSRMKMIVVSLPLRTISSRSASDARKGNPPKFLPADANAFGAARSLLNRASSMIRLMREDTRILKPPEQSCKRQAAQVLEWWPGTGGVSATVGVRLSCRRGERCRRLLHISGWAPGWVKLSLALLEFIALERFA